MTPMPNHCIDCDKIATVKLNNTPYCAKCGTIALIDNDAEAKTIGVEDGKN